MISIEMLALKDIFFMKFEMLQSSRRWKLQIFVY